MKKLRNMHPLKEIVVQGESITLGFLLSPIIIRYGKYRGKIGKKKGKR